MLSDIINAPLEELCIEASRVRTEAFGDVVDMCAIVNVKNGLCPMDCHFCAQSCLYDTSLKTYPLLQVEELVRETSQLWEQNVFRVGWVSSGCSPSTEELDRIIEAATTVLAANSAKQICASLGQLDTMVLKRLQVAGFCRYHHNLETSERFYNSICTTQRWQDRRATVERVKELGWSVCSGGLFGLGETWDDRWQLALTLQKMEVDSVPINFFTPITGTPLADRTPLLLEETLRIVILFRLTLPKATIRICGGRPAVQERSGVSPQFFSKLLFCAGANALMTGNYLTTSGISPNKDQEMIESNGYVTYPASERAED